MGEMDMCGMGTGAGPSFLEESDTNSSVSRLVLFNTSLYSLCSFAWELVYLGKSSSSKMAYVEWKMIFSCV